MRKYGHEYSIFSTCKISYSAGISPDIKTFLARLKIRVLFIPGVADDN
jgi:hypothetical protein